ncbi:MAG TPA: CoA ester lyase [Acidimicrobiales bacterium]|nr:CoA ester lyase [Acidimicrobiales bacterium]
MVLATRLERAPRSYLYVPATSTEKLAKVLTKGADAVIVDLEDGVAPGRKDEARELASAWVASVDPELLAGTEIWVRVNSGAQGEIDLAALPLDRLRGVCVPKVHGPANLEPVRQQLLHRLAAHEPPLPSSPRLMPLIETAEGVLRAEEIARSDGVERMQLGEVDLGAELGAENGHGDIAFLLARLQLVLVSAAAKIGPPVGPVGLDLAKMDDFRTSSELLKQLGYRSRACIHPAQVVIANSVFLPSSEELSRARALTEAFDQALSQGAGAVRDATGKMVDEAVVRHARRLLEGTGDVAGSSGPGESQDK